MIKATVIEELFYYNNIIKHQGRAAALAPFGFFFVFSALVSAWYGTYLKEYLPYYVTQIWILYAFLLFYSPLLILFASLKALFQRKKSANYHGLKVAITKIFSFLSEKMIIPLDTVVLPVKTVIGFCIILERSKFFNDTISFTFWFLVVYFIPDLLLTVFLAIAKVTFIRPLFPEQRTLSRIPSLIEPVTIIVVTLNLVLGPLRSTQHT